MSIFDNFKTAIFPGINDSPREATADLAGNPSDLISRVNGLIDKLNYLFKPTWGNASIYVDEINGDDGLDGSTSEAALQTLDAAMSLISTKTIDSTLTLFLSNFTLTSIDLASVRANKGSELIITKGTGYLNFIQSIESDENLVTNKLTDFKVTISDAVFNHFKSQEVKFLADIELKNCTFQASNDYAGNLLKLDSLVDSKLSGNYFYGEQQNYQSGNLLAINSCDNLNLRNNYFYYSTNTPITISYSNVNFEKYNQISEDYLSQGSKALTITSSLVKIGNDNNITAQNTEVIDSKVINNSIENESIKSLFFNFDLIQDTNRTLILNSATTGSIKALYFSSDENTATVSLSINNNTITANTDTYGTLLLELSDTNNRLLKNNGDKVSIAVTGTATNLTLQLNIIEF